MSARETVAVLTLPIAAETVPVLVAALEAAYGPGLRAVGDGATFTITREAAS